MQLNEKQKIQESEYKLPIHWLLKRATLERYQGVSNILAEAIRTYKSEGIVLDIGCGDGRGIHDLYDILDDKFEYISVDYSERAILFAKAFNYGNEIKFIRTDAGNVENLYKKNSIDIIIYRDVIEHLQEKEVQKTLKGAYILLKKNGILLITVPTINSPLEKKHYRHYSIEILHKKLKKDSFIPKKMIGYVYQPIYLYPILKKLANLPILWRCYRLFLKVVDTKCAKILICLACKE